MLISVAFSMASPDKQIDVNRQQVSGVYDVTEPTIWRTIGRLLHETLYIGFFSGLHWVINWGLVKTHQDQEWSAQYLVHVSKAFAVIAFTVIFGSELIVQCKNAILFAYNEVWKKR
jgi:hypothetical protein